ncbi:MAG: DJ-1/PfpI family protein [Oscillospiraceae bacterium]|nr:DJ-1/PfpI family protein [Oscillospiraceae bacterium]
MVYVFLANGFEECEAVAPIDMLRRANLNVITVKVCGGEELEDDDVTGSRNIKITADIHLEEIDLRSLQNLQMIVLPGGLAGTENLFKSEKLAKIIDYCVENKIKIGAICAAPSILARRGYLKNIRATAFPTFRRYLSEGGALAEEIKNVVTDDIFTTGDGVKSSIDFAIELVRVLKGDEWADSVGTDKPAPLS